MELAEVQASFPEVDCRLFPRKDAAAAYALLKQLRDAFGKSALSEEDALRRESLRQGVEFRAEQRVSAAGADDFLPRLESEITLDYRKDPRDQRPFELLNKTNQFNLNGRRYTESDWQTYLASGDTFVQVASYADKFGPLGKIAVISGRARNGCLEIDSWVMSCRAFSRRIEHCCLEQLFERFGIAKARFDFAATARNGPLREFLEEVLQTPPQPGFEIVKSDFLSRRPAWFHQVKEVAS
jgi:FkbH-like protein